MGKSLEGTFHRSDTLRLNMHVERCSSSVLKEQVFVEGPLYIQETS